MNPALPNPADLEKTSLHGKTILLVDDDKPILSALTKVLSRAGAIVRSADGSAEALAILSEMEVGFDAVITDLRMPMASGKSILSMVKTAHPEIPVIIMSAFWSDEIKDACVKLGCTHFLDKPLSSKEMLDSIAGILEEAPQV